MPLARRANHYDKIEPIAWLVYDDRGYDGQDPVAIVLDKETLHEMLKEDQQLDHVTLPVYWAGNKPVYRDVLHVDAVLCSCLSCTCSKTPHTNISWSTRKELDRGQCDPVKKTYSLSWRIAVEGYDAAAVWKAFSQCLREVLSYNGEDVKSSLPNGEIYGHDARENLHELFQALEEAEDGS